MGLLPGLIEKGRLPFDVALIQVSMPDDHGFVSLGVSVDITRAATLQAKIVIAEINPNMPCTLGDTFIPMDRIDHLVWVDTPITEYLHKPADDVVEQIARYTARIIEDNATLQIGLGQIPNEMLKYLDSRNNLGIHSDVITEPVVDLIEKGIITGNAKTIHRGQVVASYCMGTKRLYDFVHKNPMFSFHPMDYVCDISMISRNYRMVSVSQAFAIDLTGQVCSDQFGGEFYGGVSTQPDFLKGAAASPGGKPIICLSSTTDQGRVSRIRPQLLEGEGITIPRSDVHYVITEYGSAYLFCKTIQERALALIEIAHPEFRPWLLEEAKRLGYLSPNQTVKSKMAYPHEEEQEVELKNGANVLIRPAKASDVQGMKDIFYNLSERDIYTRFFTQLKSLSVSSARHLCNVDYEHEMAFMAITEDQGNKKIVGSACYFVDPSDNLGEVAYMIHPRWQGTGLGTMLQQQMARYAKSKGLRGFKADILSENKKMISVMQKGFPDLTVTQSASVCEVTMLF
jgi:RimJ/RimL family protein N-acetyltransferase